MEQKTKVKPVKAALAPGNLAAVRIRGRTMVRTTIVDAMNMLRLYKNNFCVVVPNTPTYLGMLKQAKDYITWGEIDDETFKLLVEKRGEEFHGRETDSKELIKYNDYFVVGGKKLKRYFRLNSPRKGFGRIGIKQSFQRGGALGYRGAKINDLIKKMV
ncbi:MAG TPA: uL30 family ribosomal protein [Candidatus Nanoarchaeia archaeon]|nr:uL30 family ribosomal protein [Candidatus Nanoarchaeia archaeon]